MRGSEGFYFSDVALEITGEACESHMEGVRLNDASVCAAACSWAGSWFWCITLGIQVLVEVDKERRVGVLDVVSCIDATLDVLKELEDEYREAFN